MVIPFMDLPFALALPAWFYREVVETSEVQNSRRLADTIGAVASTPQSNRGPSQVQNLRLFAGRLTHGPVGRPSGGREQEPGP